MTLAVLLGAAGLGAVRGGQLDAFVATHGSLSDVAARTLGFGVDIVTVSGATHMSESRILSIAGISSKNSLPFFDVAAARARLEADPLVKQASVRKLYPNQIVVEIVERTPYGVWQKDGQVRAIAADGAPIDEVRDGRYVDLPFVVGEGANTRVREFTALLDAMDELKPRVEAGILVGQRSWNLKLKSGVEIKLPGGRPAGRDRDPAAPPAPVPHSRPRRARARSSHARAACSCGCRRNRPPNGPTPMRQRKAAQP